MVQLKTREQVLEDFARKGISIKKWAYDHNINPATVRAVLKDPNRKASIGQSHKAAVLLGIKAGEICE